MLALVGFMLLMMYVRSSVHRQHRVQTLAIARLQQWPAQIADRIAELPLVGIVGDQHQHIAGRRLQQLRGSLTRSRPSRDSGAERFDVHVRNAGARGWRTLDVIVVVVVVDDDVDGCGRGSTVLGAQLR